MRRTAWTSAALLGVLLAACSSKTARPTDALNDGVQGGDAGACNAIFLYPAVMQMQVAAAAPAPTGGTVMTGVYYVLTAFNTYTGVGGASGSTGRTFAEVIETVPTHWQYVSSDNGGPEQRETANVTFAGATLTQQFTCPSMTVTSQMYSTTTTELHLYKTGATTTDELVFTMR